MVCPCCKPRCAGCGTAYPEYVTITLTVGNQSNPGSIFQTNCSRPTAAEQFLNGTYILPYFQDHQGSGGGASYVFVRGDGFRIGYTAYCSQAGNSTGSLDWQYCNLNTTCYQRVNHSQGATATSAGTLVCTTICGGTGGSGTVNAGLHNFLSSCSQNNGFAFDSFYVAVQIVFSL
jgi:hypothetical protein